MTRRSPVQVLVHVVWATRRRRPILPRSFDPTLFAILGDNARSLGCILRVAGCASDHVHVVVRVAATVTLASLVQRLKGASSHDINGRSLLADRISWQDGYWAESLAPDDEGALARYVRGQRDHHDDSHPAERWSFGATIEPAPGRAYPRRRST